MDVGAVVFLIFLLIAAAIMLLAFLLEESAQKKAEGLKNAVEIRDDEVVLPRRMRLTRGRFYLRGYWSGSGRHRHYHVERRFTAEGEVEAERIRLKPERFTLIVALDGNAMIDVPAYLVREPDFKDVLLIPVVPSYRFELERDSLEVSKDMEFAHARMEVKERGIRGRLYATVQKCRGARLELRTRKPDAVEKIAETRESAEFSREFLGEKLLMVSHGKAADPRHFTRPFGRRVLIEGHGEYPVRLTLDVPLGRDVHDETVLRVEPSGEIPEGRPRVEVVV